MTLSSDQAALFYKLWIPLLDFVNQKYGLIKDLYGMTSPVGLRISDVQTIRDRLWQECGLLDEYIALNPHHLADDELSIIAGWKHPIHGPFVVLRHLKSGSIFLLNDDAKVAYIVKGIYSCWQEMLRSTPLPCLINTVLIPFADTIIPDSIVQTHNVSLGSNLRREANERYATIKAAGGVKKTLNAPSESALTNPRRNSMRDARIENDILCDVYGEDEEMSAWQAYLDDSIDFPFTAKVKELSPFSPLKINERVDVIHLADYDIRHNGQYVTVSWHEREFAVPLETLTPLNVSAEAKEAIQDWQYWCRRNS